MSSDAALWSGLRSLLVPVFAEYRARLVELSVETKADRTLLTEADVEVQRLIVEAIREVEPQAVVIAEEDERTQPRKDVADSDGRLWVVDPIDGTAEFVRPERTEFCSVVCRFEDWRPTSAFVLAPELGAGRTPLVVTADAGSGEALSNGEPVTAPSKPSGHLSATRSRGVEVPAIDAAAEQAGYTVKSRTTSQTLDMVRTALDLAAVTEPPCPHFDLFWRRRQKLWDGAAGLCLGTATGLVGCAEDGGELPWGREFLSRPTPVFPSDVLGRPEVVDWFVRSVRV